ncbi:FAD/NAD(P)-binding domain-containing protein [Heliocybe sulcata]|uniref:FAD/NAD(P)-binding domain-containing protein n=1 Tax=Heliocybe sulcata TaxID=5364 RepID=A0A5C3N064_9AGAM|nr:FAD/NAD(P)-binding domain-containing protein [Heliocybe sulcata]
MASYGKASASLSITVIGGGTAGLACAYALQAAGHRVCLLEKNPGRDTSARGGVLCPPNMTRILNHWGLGSLFPTAPRNRGVHFKLGTNQEIVRSSPFPDDFMRAFGADYLFLTYSDLLDALYDSALKAGVLFQYNTTVVTIDPDNARVELAGGKVIEGDIIVAADGVHSLARPLVSESVARHGQPWHYHQASSSISADILRVNTELAPLLNATELNIWMGDGYGILGYPIHDRDLYAVDVTWLEKSTNGEDGICGPFEELSLDATGVKVDELDAKLRALVSLPKVLRHSVFTPQEPPERLVHNSGKLILMGGAAHPSPVHWTHGTALTIEDAATLGALFSHLSSRAQISAFISAFEDIRLPRCANVIKADVSNLETVVHPRSTSVADQTADSPKPPPSEPVPKTLTGWDEVFESNYQAEWEELIAMFDYDANDVSEEWWVTWGSLMQRAAHSSLSQPETDLQLLSTPLPELLSSY